MASRASLRASDADRERVAERLRHAAAEGRILAHELEERLARALRAQTYGELDRVVADLPGGRAAQPASRSRSRSRELARAHPVAAAAVAVVVGLVAVAVVALLAAGFLAACLAWLVFTTLLGGRHRRHAYWYRQRSYGPRRV